MSFNAAKKIAAFPFPFPYAQMLMVMLCIHWFTAPIMAALALQDALMCVAATFITSLAFWCINYIAAELEMPFGDNANDLPVEELQVNFNESLCRLMNPIVQVQPLFVYKKERHDLLQYTKMAAVENMFLKDGPKERNMHHSLRAQTIMATRRSPDSNSNSLVQAKQKEETIVMEMPEQPFRAGSASSSSEPAPEQPFRPGSDVKLQPKALETTPRSPRQSASAVAAAELRAGLSSPPRDQDSAGINIPLGLAFRKGHDVMGEEKKKGAPLSAEEWQAFDQELAGLAARVEERLSKIVQELVHLLVPAACGRLAEASTLAQGLIHPTKPWAPASDATRFSSQIQPSPEPELLQGVTQSEVVMEPESSFDTSERLLKISQRGGVLTAM